MSIDRDSKLRNGIVREAAPPQLNVEFEIRQCREAHRRVWEQLSLPMFTRHDADHSLAIVEYFNKLEPRYQWSQREYAIFEIAAFIHDIGMQYNDWASLPQKDKGFLYEALDFPEPPIDWNAVRKGHLEFGRRLIRAETMKQRNWTLPLPFSTETVEGLRLLSQAALVAFAHSRGDQWDEFKDPNRAEFRRKNAGYGQTVRLRLLAGTLRFCDELHSDHTRVPDADRILAANIPEESKLHWLAAYFTHEIELNVPEHEDHAVAVKLRSRWPTGNDPVLQDAITQLLDTKRSRIKDEEVEIAHMYQSGGEEHYRLSAHVDFEPEPADRIDEPISTQIRELVVARARHLRPLPPVVSGVHAELASASPKPGTTEATSSRQAIPNLRAGGNPAMEHMLRRWLTLHREPGHFRLVRGAHTDSLIRLRSLASDSELQHALAIEVKRILGDEPLGGVLAVGTSSIPLATIIALQHSVPMSFAIHGIEGQHENYSKPSKYDLKHDFRKPVSDRLLVLDDLMAHGKGSGLLVDQLVTDGIVSPEKIVYICLYRLGDQQPYLRGGVSYITLCDIPDIYYAPNGDTCALTGEAISELDLQ